MARTADPDDPSTCPWQDKRLWRGAFLTILSMAGLLLTPLLVMAVSA
jgi:hypothetical protein